MASSELELVQGSEAGRANYICLRVRIDSDVGFRFRLLRLRYAIVLQTAWLQLKLERLCVCSFVCESDKADMRFNMLLDLLKTRITLHWTCLIH